MPDTPFPTPELQHQADDLEEHLRKTEAEHAAAHPVHEGWSPMVGQDVDGDDEETPGEEK